MSTTRSPSRPGPATERPDWARAALVLVGHGSNRDGGSNPALLAHAAALRARGIFAEVRAAALYGAPRPEQALSGLQAAEVYLAPLFMAEGHFARVGLREAFGLDGRLTVVGGRRVVLCPPLGLQPGLTRLCLARAEARARREGLSPQATRLLFVGHGSSRDPAPREAALWHAEAARGAAVFGGVDEAFLDEPPFLCDVLGGLGGASVAVGLFAAGGLHAGEDVPALIARWARVPVHYLGAIGEDPAISDLVLAQVAAASPCLPTEPVAV